MDFEAAKGETQMGINAKNYGDNSSQNSHELNDRKMSNSTK